MTSAEMTAYASYIRGWDDGVETILSSLAWAPDENLVAVVRDLQQRHGVRVRFTQQENHGVEWNVDHTHEETL